VLLGLRTVIYKAPDLVRAKRWFREVFDVTPYFDEPFYVGFNVGDFELGLDPDVKAQVPGPGGTVAYWRVADLRSALERVATSGAVVVAPLQDVGGGILVATISDPFGNLLGLIEDPKFAAPA
jgi:predicted enzyme related to lactoylglutathione lyase